MAQRPQSNLLVPRHIAAALVLVGKGTTAEDLDPTMILTWYVEDGIPFGNSEEAGNALECTEDLLAQINELMALDENYVPDGFSSERWAFFREALQDGANAIVAEIDELEELDEVCEELEDLYDSLVMMQVVEAPELEVDEEFVDMTES